MPAGFAATRVGTFAPARTGLAGPLAADFAGALAAGFGVALAVVLIAAFGTARLPAFAGTRAAGLPTALAAAAFAAPAGLFVEMEAAARAPARDAVLGESFDTLEATFLDADCLTDFGLTDFATFTSLSRACCQRPGIETRKRRAGEADRMRPAKPSGWTLGNLALYQVRLRSAISD
ncbi:MAG: hypothetical protein EHM83_14385 [Burkholderiales bacterium]|nr:MAG: hypothetical protein EHM83_14385 [Burkholderiales bacterium]